jgi:hypothetical protein
MSAGEADDTAAPDWIGMATYIARNAPGFGDPLGMPCDMFLEVAEAVSDMLRGENGDAGRAAVDREMRRKLNV